MSAVYVVATPIGNLQDITLRGIQTLRDTEIIICEDTRVTQVLLNKFNIKEKKLIALNEFNEEEVIPNILEIVLSRDIALVSDAGTPLISDPGFRLIREAKKRNILTIPIPGPTAPITALSVSGFPTDKFTFLGFLPKSQAKQYKIFEKYKNENHTVIFFESPHRLTKTLKTLDECFGDISICLARELTKKFEEIINLRISDHLKIYKNKKPKGEFTIIFNPSITF